MTPLSNHACMCAGKARMQWRPRKSLSPAGHSRRGLPSLGIMPAIPGSSRATRRSHIDCAAQRIEAPLLLLPSRNWQSLAIFLSNISS